MSKILETFVMIEGYKSLNFIGKVLYFTNKIIINIIALILKFAEKVK